MKYNLIVMVISVILCFSLAESFTRLTVKERWFWEPDQELGTRHISNKTAYWCQEEFCHRSTTNTDGFIDDNFSINVSPGKTRIFLFGDSMIEALQVDISNSTHSILENKLKETGADAEVLNFGVSGYGTDQSLMALKKYGPIYKPDVVIFTVYVGNDLLEINPDLNGNRCKPYFKLEEGSLKSIPFECNPDKIKEFLKNSKFLQLIKYEIDIHSMAKSAIASQDNLPLNFYVYQKGNQAFENSFILNDHIILEAKNYTESIGGRFVLIILPDSVQLDDARWGKYLGLYPQMKEMQFDLGYPDRRIGVLCDANNIDCLDLSSPFKDNMNQTGEKLYYGKDIHWNEKGNSLAADSIFKHINEKKLI